MKRFIAVTLLLGGIIVSLSAQKTITRFGVVDMNRIIAMYTDQAAIKAFNEKRDRVQAEIERQNQELRELNARLAEARGKRNNSGQVNALEAEIQAKTQAAKDYIDTMRAEMERDREQLNEKMNMTQINNAIRIVAEAEGCSMVLSREGGTVLWNSPTVDITAKVIQRLTGRQ